MTQNDAKIVVVIPRDNEIRQLIDLTAKFVAIDGDPFEQVNFAVCVPLACVCLSVSVSR